MDEREVEKRVCRTLWREFNAFYDQVTKEPMSDHDIEVEYGLTELGERLGEVLPYGPHEVHDEPGRKS